MEQIKKIFIYIFQPKIIILGVAAYNFISLWLDSKLFTGITCFACPWYFDWSYSNEPSIILFSAFLLLLKKRWSFAVSSIFSGYVVVKALYLITKGGWAEWLYYFVNQWNTRNELELDILKIYELQVVLAFAISCLAIYYLIRESPQKNNLRQKFLPITKFKSHPQN